MRDYTRIDQYLDALRAEIYPQPPDEGHTHWARTTLEKFEGYIDMGIRGKTVLDIGAGQGFMQPIFEEKGAVYTGITMGDDVISAKQQGRNVMEMDMHFLTFADNSFDFLFARHVLEHSVMPLIALMEWGRVVKPNGYMILVAPAPQFWTVAGRNHYSVKYLEQLAVDFGSTGWHISAQDILYTTQADFQKFHPEEVVNFPKEVEFRFLLRYQGVME